jgi:hypothetical protein
MHRCFDVWDVFILSKNVQFGSYVGSDGALSALKFTVSKDSDDSGTPFLVYAMDFSQRCDDRLFGPVVESSSGDELDILIYG